MNLTNWIIGPQLIGLVFLIAGLGQYYFPPKHINDLYGYRMPSSKKNQQTWDEANHYSAKYMIKSGIVLLVVGVIIAMVLSSVSIPTKIKQVLPAILLIFSGMISAVLSIVATEKHLEKTFKNTE